MYQIHKLKILFFILLLGFTSCSENQNKPTRKNNPAGKISGVKKANFESFLFVGMIEHKPGIYKYDVDKKKVSQFWSNYNEQVVDLSYSPDWKNVFFLTAGHLGKKNILPYITRVKLYFVNRDSGTVQFIKRIGKGIQVFTEWINNNNFKVILNKQDLIVGTYIKQRTLIYNTFGKELLNETQIYDLTKSPYPRPVKQNDKLNSPKGRYKFIINSSDSTLILLLDKNKNRLEPVISNSQKLNRFSWSPDEKFLFISTINITAENKTLTISKPETSNLFIYDIEKEKIVKSWSGGGVKNFFIKNDFLIFDNGFKDNSEIVIYNYKLHKLYDKIKIKKGCGLRNIPEIPNFKF